MAYIGQELRDRTRPLAQHPELAHREPRLADSMRELVVHQNYIIYYRVLAEGRTVEVLRVKHAAQQAP